MTTELATARARRASWIVGLAVAVAALAGITVGIQSRSRDAQAASGLVLPAFSQKAKDASRIIIVSKDARYEILRTEKGWALKDRGAYPVRRERLGQFTRGLESLAYLRPMTGDPERHDRLGLGDPTKGGSGVLVQVEDARGARFADLIIGAEPGGALFLRKPDQAQTWQVRGDLPSLTDPAEWLDLVPFELDRARIKNADLQFAVGGAYGITRSTDSDGFTLAPPNNTRDVVAPATISAAASGIARLQPIDVRQAAAIGGAPAARVFTRTFDGLLIEADLFAEPNDKYWVKLIARAEDPARESEAAKINARAAPWAYGLRRDDYEDLAPPLSSLIQQPLPSAPTPPTP
ncbi:MAG: DUF4340 domain-containing protein [Alphaproteobacteria bacterium]|nr:DUF4340 domain-containing protein [Alphaproteobacteria bacterium]